MLGGSCYEDLVMRILLWRILLGGSCYEDLVRRILFRRIFVMRILL